MRDVVGGETRLSKAVVFYVASILLELWTNESLWFVGWLLHKNVPVARSVDDTNCLRSEFEM